MICEHVAHNSAIIERMKQFMHPSGSNHRQAGVIGSKHDVAIIDLILKSSLRGEKAGAEIEAKSLSRSDGCRCGHCSLQIVRRGSERHRVAASAGRYISN